LLEIHYIDKEGGKKWWYPWERKLKSLVSESEYRNLFRPVDGHKSKCPREFAATNNIVINIDPRECVSTKKSPFW